jgi:hypothetical protein
MGKKQKKLSEEEIEEYKYENFQMMAAMSGKPISELMGESSRPNYKENYCLTKQMYLKNCIEPISSRQLYELLQKQGYEGKYSTFRGLLNNYQKYGYIKKVNAKKPFLYILTAEGRVHAKNPYIAVDENIQRYRNMLLQKMKELIESQPELFKSIYEIIFGVQSATNIIGSTSFTGNQYSPNDVGSELQHDLEYQIFTPDFFKNADEQKLKALVDGILDNSLSDEQKKQLILDAIEEAAKSQKTITVKQPEYQSSKPIGLRDYYEILIAAEGKVVTKSTYEALPFRFLKVGNELRLKGKGEVGTYRNNNDSKDLNFYEANAQYFNNRMIIKRIPNFEKREHEFYYSYGSFGKKITTISFDDYTKVKNNSVKTTLKINPAPKNN